MHLLLNAMPRAARIVVPGIPHHVTQRGNRRQQTFFSDADYGRYLGLIAKGCREAKAEVLAWCLMPNHVHLVLVPSTQGGLADALAGAHQCYSWLVNRRNGWQGHLWQSRFYSCPLDDAHVVAAVRYVELNPLRARLVATPEQWRWSSTRGRVSGNGDDLIDGERPPALRNVGDWLAFLAEGLDDETAERLRAHQRTGAALGAAEFLAHIEALIGRSVRRRPRGRQPREPGLSGRAHPQSQIDLL